MTAAAILKITENQKNRDISAPIITKFDMMMQNGFLNRLDR